MIKYKYLAHPADLKIQIFGNNLKELFANAALGMMEYIYPASAVGINTNSRCRKETIKIKANDLKSLMVDWLSELLYLSDTNNCAYTQFRFKKLTKNQLEAKVIGCLAKAQEDIKAVTYHGLKIKLTKNGWQATVLFDI
jgi:SHS2 domain-containing protein